MKNKIRSINYDNITTINMDNKILTDIVNEAEEGSYYYK
jgi:hypothetical protein